MNNTPSEENKNEAEVEISSFSEESICERMLEYFNKIVEKLQ